MIAAVSDAVLLAIIAGIPASIIALAGLVKVVYDVKQLRVAVNHRLDELVALTRKDAFAQGVKEEKEKGI